MLNKFIGAISKNRRDLALITAVFLFASLILYGWFYFFTPGKMDVVLRNWDGPGYVVVAKSFYSVDIIEKVNKLESVSTLDFAFQFPLYPLFIRLFSFLGYNYSMIFVSQLFSLMFIILAYFFIKMVNPKANTLIIGLLLIFYTPRWFIISHTGSAEPLLLCCVTLFLMFFLKKRFVLSALFAAAA